MDSSTDDGLFNALVHSLRSCIQFLNFKEHISIRGFLALDVDGCHQSDFVIEELITKSEKNERNSFQLKSLSPTRNHPGSSLSPQSLNNRKLGVFKPKSCQTPINLKRNFRSNASFERKRKNQPAIVHGADSSRSSQSVRRKFTNGRNDLKNLTFTKDPGPGASKWPDPRANSGVDVKKSVSVSTVDISPSKSMLVSRKISYTGTCSDMSKMTRSRWYDEERKKEEVNDSTVKQTQDSFTRPVKLHGVISLEDATVPKARDPPNGCDNRNGVRHHNTLEELRGATGRSWESKDTRRNFSLHNFESFELEDLDSEGSITSVQPNYLVGHSDDIITIPSIHTDVMGKNNINIYVSQKIESNNHNHQSKVLDKPNLELNYTSSQRRQEANGKRNRDKSKYYPESREESLFFKRTSECFGGHKRIEVDFPNTRGNYQSRSFAGSREEYGGCEKSSVSAVPGERNDDRESTMLSRLENGSEEMDESNPAAKKKRKFMKLMRYFKKSQEDN